MSTIDRAALIEQAATSLDDQLREMSLTSDAPAETAALLFRMFHPDHAASIAVALPVITKALLAPLRELHRPCNDHAGECEMRNGIAVRYCNACEACDFPCPTVRLLDAIEAEVQQ